MTTLDQISRKAWLRQVRLLLRELNKAASAFSELPDFRNGYLLAIAQRNLDKKLYEQPL